MFTGLVRAVGTVAGVRPLGGGRRISVDLAGLDKRPEAPPLAAGASIAVNGVCLTVTSLANGIADFDAVTETISRTNLRAARAGTRVNLEPALRAGDALDGHIVQGHVDAAVALLSMRRLPESALLEFALPAGLAGLVAEKGSVALDGVSLTVTCADAGRFGVSIIPQTLSDTTLGALVPGAEANLEVDVLARYAARWLAAGAGGGAGAGVSEESLRRNGFI